jgi:hypothetical protein
MQMIETRGYIKSLDPLTTKDTKASHKGHKDLIVMALPLCSSCDLSVSAWTRSLPE